MWERLLLALDQFDSGQNALALTSGLAARSGAGVVVLHVRERMQRMQVPPLETPVEAHELVDDAVRRLAGDGVDAYGLLTSAPQHRIAEQIVEQATAWDCDAVVLGSNRLRGIRRVGGSGVRERVVRASGLPVVVAPASLRLRSRLRGADVPVGQLVVRH